MNPFYAKLISAMVPLAIVTGFTIAGAAQASTVPGSFMLAERLAAAPPEHDDYPQPYRSARPDSVDDSFGGFPNRECTSFVAFRMARDGHPLNGIGGDAGVWDSSAIAHGWTVDHTPTVGSIAQFHGGEAGAFAAGHVAYVAAVDPNGTVYVEDYNWNPHAYKLHALPAGAPRYIHPPSNTVLAPAPAPAPPPARPAAPSSSSLGCHASTCDQLDPVQTGCARDAQTAGRGTILDANGRNVGDIYLRWSPACQNNWGRADFNDGNPPDGTYVLVTVRGADGEAQFPYTGSGTPVWGNMIYSPGCAKATVVRYDQNTNEVKMYGVAVQEGCSL